MNYRKTDRGTNRVRRLVRVKVLRDSRGSTPYVLSISDPLSPIGGIHCTLDDLIEINRVTGLAIASAARRKNRGLA